MLLRLVYAWIANVAALSVAAYVIDEIDYSDDYWVLIAAALVFSLVNAFVKPVLKLLAAPLIVITLGLALFAINLLMLYVTDWLVPGLELGTFMAAVWATVIVTAVNWAFSIVFGMGR